MPKTLVTTQTVYQFGELSDSAKDKAREWFREASIHDEWWDATYEDAEQCAAILGIEIAARNQKCVFTGPNRREWIDSSPAIYFSGFSSQGDGACFEGSYSYAKGAAKAIREHAPQDVELHRIADELQTVQRRNFYRASLTVRQRGHYSHSGCMECERIDDCAVADEGELFQLMRDFADWIYRQLEREHDYLNSDACVDESILANEYEFTEEGARA